MSVEYLRKEHKTDAETFAWPRVPRLPFYHCKCLCKEGAEQRLQRLEITLLSFFIFFFSKLRSPFSRSLSVHEPMSIHRSLAKAAVWKQTVMLIPARFDLWECELGLRTVRLSSVLTNKRRDKSTLSIVVTPVHGASPTARMIAGIGEDAPPRWHNAPQASIYAWEEIRSASPVVSTSIHNIHQWSANIILLMIQPLLKYGLQNRLTYCTCLCTSCQAFLARCKRDVACLPALGGGG